MSIEPTCLFCGASDKFRCKTSEQARTCRLMEEEGWNLDSVNDDPDGDSCKEFYEKVKKHLREKG
jgi:hypothetical protein